MKFEKLFYVILSAVVISALIIISYIFSPFNSELTSIDSEKKIFYVDHISGAHQKVIDLFNKKYEGEIKVEAINLPFEKFSTNERKELLARYLRSKSDRIDIFSVDQIWVPRFAKWCIPLDKYLSKKEKEILLKYAVESCYFKDTLVAVPLYIDISLMFYRRDILEKLPDYERIKEVLSESITWEDFIALHQKLNDKPFFLFQADDFEGLICIFTEMVLSQQKKIIEDGKLNLETAEAKKALTLLVDLVNKYNLSPKEVVNFKENTSYTYFIDNNALFLRGWPGFTSNDSKRYYNNSEVFNLLEKIPNPHFKGFKPVSIYGGWNLMISQHSKKIPEAVKFLNFFLSEEAQKIMYEEGNFLPVNTALYSDENFIRKNQEIKFYENLLKKGAHRPFLENYTNISDILSYYINLAIKKELTVEEALRQAAEKVNSESILLK